MRVRIVHGVIIGNRTAYLRACVIANAIYRNNGRKNDHFKEVSKHIAKRVETEV